MKARLEHDDIARVMVLGAWHVQPKKIKLWTQYPRNQSLYQMRDI